MNHAEWFADTGNWIALADTRDELHLRARAWSQRLTSTFVTTDAVLIEVAEAFSGATWRTDGRGCAVKKREVQDLLDRMPDEIDAEQLIYTLYLKQKLERAEADIAEGRLTPHAEVERLMAEWLK